jgi:hypothetical protein
MNKRGAVKEKQRFDPRLVIIEFVVEKGKMNQILLGIIRFSLSVLFHRRPLLITVIKENKLARTGNIKQDSAFCEVEEHLIEKYFHTDCVFIFMVLILK